MNRRLVIIIAVIVIGFIALGALIFYLRSRSPDDTIAPQVGTETEEPAQPEESTEEIEIPVPGPDGDQDQLSDEYELEIGTDPNHQDTDRDGFTDYFEVAIAGTDPLDSTDAPREQVREDGRLEELFGDSTTIDQLDSDNDGLMDTRENELGTDPKNPDSDSDDLTDGEEVNIHETDPLNADSDDDGLRDGDEVVVYRTDPLNADSDGDGFSDGEEVSNGYNPLGPGECTNPDCTL
jgi:hypothetical protein